MLTDKVIDTIERFGMIPKGSTVTAALSGGADSVCLLLALREIGYGIELRAIHINHLIRGDEAFRDEEFCRELCEGMGVPLTVERADVPKIASERKRSLEETAREVRYGAFERHTAGGLLATAHTASDNAETVLHNLVRGTGLKGMCGIPAVRGNIIRPLIDVTREEVEEYLTLRGMEFMTDSTNLSDDYTRNRIRHQIIPQILRINNGFFKTFCAELKIFSEENFFIEKSAKNAYNICNDNGALCGLEKYDAVIRKRCISAFLREKGLEVNYEKVCSIDEILESGGKINLEKNVYAVCRKNVLTIVRADPQQPVTVILREGENSIFDGRTVLAEFKAGSKGIIDMGKVSGDIVLRGRCFGDKIKLSGQNFTSSVKKLINSRIRPDLRPRLHFLADGEGVIFIEGIGVAERVRPDGDTAESLCITIKDVTSDA